MQRSCLPLLVVLALGLSHHTHAQGDPRSRFGLSMGLNSASLRVASDTWESSDSRMSWSFGMLGDIGLGRTGNWALGIGLRYTDIGGSLRVDANIDRGTGPTKVTGMVDLRMRYLEFPVTLTLRTTTNGPWDFHALGGLSGAFHLRTRGDGARTITEENGSSTTVYDNTSFNVDVVTFKGSAVMGAGAEYALERGPTLFAEMRYSAGLNNALSKNASLYVTDSDRTKVYPDYWEISLGVYL
jgi:hypothetical protein